MAIVLEADYLRGIQGSLENPFSQAKPNASNHVDRFTEGNRSVGEWNYETAWFSVAAGNNEGAVLPRIVAAQASVR